MNEGDKLANEYRPQFFYDYLGQGNNSPVEIIKNIISKNKHIELGNIGIFGPSGTGSKVIAC